MSFNRRTYTESNIRRTAKDSTFKEFERWMCNGDVATLDDSFASMIYDNFFKSSDRERKEIYEQIKTDEI
jgi:hypothetical protein